MKVADYMTREVVKIDKDRKLSDALELMERHRVSRLLVVNSGRIVGIITDKDVLKVMGSSKYSNKLPSSLHVSTAMSRDVLTCSPDASLADAVKLMKAHRIKSLPVVNGTSLAGILTATDVLKALVDSRVPVEEVMTREVCTVSPTERAVHARRLMLDRGISRLVVVDSGRMVGILTERQLGRALGAFRSAADAKQVNRVRNLLVGDVMTQRVVSIPESATVGEAARKMLEHGFSGMPVVSGEELRGIVTKTDLIGLVA